MSEIKLLPCPFCGGEAECSEHHEDNGGVEVYYRERTYYLVSCSKCMVTMANEIDKESVIKQWNTRKPMERIVERLEEEQKGYICDEDDYCEGAYNAYRDAILVVKEEGGIE